MYRNVLLLISIIIFIVRLAATTIGSPTSAELRKNLGFDVTLFAVHRVGVFVVVLNLIQTGFPHFFASLSSLFEFGPCNFN